MRLVGSQGIVGNWKSRWTCMSFQEEMVTKEIETEHTGHNVNIAHLRLCTFLTLLFFQFTLIFLIIPRLMVFLLCFPPQLTCE